MFLNDVQMQIGLRTQSQCYLRMSPKYLLRNRMQLKLCLKFEEMFFCAGQVHHSQGSIVSGIVQWVSSSRNEECRPRRSKTQRGRHGI